MHASCAAWQIAGIFDRRDGGEDRRSRKPEDRPAFFPRARSGKPFAVPSSWPPSFSFRPVEQSAPLPLRERKANAVKKRERGEERGAQGGDRERQRCSLICRGLTIDPFRERSKR